MNTSEDDLAQRRVLEDSMTPTLTALLLLNPKLNLDLFYLIDSLVTGGLPGSFCP